MCNYTMTFPSLLQYSLIIIFLLIILSFIKNVKIYLKLSKSLSLKLMNLRPSTKWQIPIASGFLVLGTTSRKIFLGSKSMYTYLIFVSHFIKLSIKRYLFDTSLCSYLVVVNMFVGIWENNIKISLMYIIGYLNVFMLSISYYVVSFLFS